MLLNLSNFTDSFMGILFLTLMVILIILAIGVSAGVYHQSKNRAKRNPNTYYSHGNKKEKGRTSGNEPGRK